MTPDSFWCILREKLMCRRHRAKSPSGSSAALVTMRDSTLWLIFLIDHLGFFSKVFPHCFFFVPCFFLEPPSISSFLFLFLQVPNRISFLQVPLSIQLRLHLILLVPLILDLVLTTLVKHQRCFSWELGPLSTFEHSRFREHLFSCNWSSVSSTSSSSPNALHSSAHSQSTSIKQDEPFPVCFVFSFTCGLWSCSFSRTEHISVVVFSASHVHDFRLCPLLRLQQLWRPPPLAYQRPCHVHHRLLVILVGIPRFFERTQKGNWRQLAWTKRHWQKPTTPEILWNIKRSHFSADIASQNFFTPSDSTHPTGTSADLSDLRAPTFFVYHVRCHFGGDQLSHAAHLVMPFRGSSQESRMFFPWAATAPLCEENWLQNMSIRVGAHDGSNFISGAKDTPRTNLEASCSCECFGPGTKTWHNNRKNMRFTDAPQLRFWCSTHTPRSSPIARAPVFRRPMRRTSCLRVSPKVSKTACNKLNVGMASSSLD